MALTAEQLSEAMRRVASWRTDPATPVQCPVCGTPGLGIADRSARPHAEWYALSCSACGLAETLHIPLGAAVPTLD